MMIVDVPVSFPGRSVDVFCRRAVNVAWRCVVAGVLRCVEVAASRVRVGGEGSDGTADLLASAEIDGSRIGEWGPGRCLEMDREIAGVIARWEAVRLLVRAQFARGRPVEVAGSSASRGRGGPVGGAGEGADGSPRMFAAFAGDELSLVANVAATQGCRELAFAERCVRRLPEAVVALAQGVLDVGRVAALDRFTVNLADGHAREVLGPVLGNGGGRRTHRAFGAAVSRRVAKVDPDGADRRRRKAEKKRGVALHPEADGMGRLSALLPAEQALAAFTRIDELAKQADDQVDDQGNAQAGGQGNGRTDGRRGDQTDGRGDAEGREKRSLAQRRADVLFDLLMGRDRGRVNVEMQVIVPFETLMGLAQHPGEVPGYGPIPAEIVREMTADAGCTWRRVLTAPKRGQVLDVGDRRFPSAPLARYVRARNTTCVFPTCDLPATSCDLDHTRGSARGGRTEPGNLGPQCRAHHRLKHQADRMPAGAGKRWDLRQPEPGHFVWTTPEEQVYHVYPETYADF